MIYRLLFCACVLLFLAKPHSLLAQTYKATYKLQSAVKKPKPGSEEEEKLKALEAQTNLRMPDYVYFIRRALIDEEQGYSFWLVRPDSTVKEAENELPVAVPPKEFFFAHKTGLLQRIEEQQEQGACQKLASIEYKKIKGRKEIAGYRCRAAQALPEQGIAEHIIWYCPKLSKHIHPGIDAKGIKGAVLGIEKEGSYYLELTELQKDAELPKMKAFPECPDISSDDYLLSPELKKYF